MKTPSYRSAVAYVALNEDCDGLAYSPPSPSISMHLVADLFGVPVERVCDDIRKFILKAAKG